MELISSPVPMFKRVKMARRSGCCRSATLETVSVLEYLVRIWPDSKKSWLLTYKYLAMVLERTAPPCSR
jgi:hypothetical protein